LTGAPGGGGTGAGACPRGHCRLAACPGDRILRIHSRILGLIYSLRAIYSCMARQHAQLRDLGRSSPDPVRVCAQCASSARHVSDSAAFCDPRSLRLLPHHRPTDVWCKVFRLAPLPPPRSPRSPIHVVIPPSINHDPPAVAGRALSARRKGPSSSPCEAPLASEAFILVIGHRQPVSPRPPPPSNALLGSLGGLLCYA
jgi:hypothetical protein